MGKVLYFKDYILKKTLNKINEMIYEVNDTDITVFLLAEDLKILLDEFYNYYEKKKIVFSYYESMTNHFADILDSMEEDDELNLFYLLKGLSLYELLESNIEVVPSETKKVINKIYYKCMRSDDDE